MGYFTLDFKKAKGASDARMSDHIERRVIAPNVDSTRTHLNRELVELPEGVTVRDEAIAHRIKSAGIKRKITPDQVRAIRVMMSGTHEDMMKIQQDGRMNEWCNDSMEWLHKTFGRENTVSAVLHMDETTPHIHATIVPIVTGERRKAKQKQTEGKRSYRKKADAARLCADDVLNRDKLIGYHDDYAKIMDKYGLQRGVRGSEARHVTTAQYYRDLKRQTGKLETGVQQLQEEREEAEKQLKQVKKEIGTQKLEAVKTEAKAALIAKVGSLLGSGEIKELKQENRQLYEEVTTRDESIEKLQTMVQEQQKQHRKELTEVQAKHIEILNERDKEISRLNRIIEKACKWFPYFMELLRIEKLCRLVGFNQELTDKLVKGEPIVCSGNLYSEKYRRKFTTEKAGFQVVKNPTDNTKLVLSINRQPISEWFKEQFNKLHQNIQSKQEQKRSKGFKL
ncbi:plasmid recombination protein [Bacteroides sp. BFG-638]|uniref:MobV family relaxase n=1 Tax=Bacteroides vicugnae TaxID=3037989 RepID=A0ABU5HSQ0_9BACE|nr:MULTISPECIES: MobV family relaxase [unclassified Bacteroides]MCS2948020.1 plasmid recombination protein [Bacteroides sp. BFG-638]MDY7252616.1 MobV family relaxase [Bacteroides sp. A1-P5]MDY7258774.1 MobV family relaxase [Bacteroides sp. A2-P53]